MTLSEKALEFATKVHAGQFRNDGRTPYIEHPRAVAKLVEDFYFQNITSLNCCAYPELLSVAFLHDIVEDCGITDQHLFDIGMPEVVINNVDLLTRRKKDSYYEYILKIINAQYNYSINFYYALVVKWADLTHNLSDLKPGSLRDKYMLAKYIIEKELNL